MQINHICQKYNISRDSIYYYIKIGLLVPACRGKQYSFDETCERDLHLVLTFKKWGFSLKEIHSVLTKFRISCVRPPKDIADVINIMQQKRELLQQEKDAISIKQMEIEAAMNKLLHTETPSTASCELGLPISMLDMLICPKCGKRFQLHNAEMSSRYIENANVTCQCGYNATISNGILLTPNNNTSPYDRPDLRREFYRDMPDELISIYQSAYNWMRDRMEHLDLDGKIILETHLNAYFFLQFQLDILQKHNCKIILMDKFPEILALYKDFLEQNNITLDVLYIADSSTNWPLIKGKIDILVDFFSSNEHNFYNNTSLIDEINCFLSIDSYIVGTYFSLSNGQRSIQKLLRDYPEASHSNFNLRLYGTHLLKNGFVQLDGKQIGETSNTGNNWCFNFMENGDEITLSSFLAKRNMHHNN